MRSFKTKIYNLLFILLLFPILAQAQFVHPGIIHKQSDLDRMKYMVECEIEPYYSTYLLLKADGQSSSSYTVRKDPDDNTLSRENPSHQRYQYEDDVQAAYKNALMWYITGDSDHAEKAIEILNAWADLKSFYGGGTEPLCAGLYGTPLINAAEIIKSTYSGWAEADIQKFKDMLVYPGYSNTTVPTDSIAADRVTFYWRTYMGDPGRHGNQGLLAWRTVMAMGIFLDNEIMYDRALRYVTGLPHRDDDLAYTSGPAIQGSIQSTSNEFFNEYKTNGRSNSVPDYGFDDQIQHYIYENGQCQESSRDQGHSSLGVGAVTELMEFAWNQGTDIYSYLDDRALLGLEFTLKYNLSDFKSFPDQTEPWEPENYLQKQVRCGRWQSLKINPHVGSDLERNSRGEGVITRPTLEMPIAHYVIREGKADKATWTLRSRDCAIALQGYETGDGCDAPGWGGLTFRRPDGCAGDPVQSIDNEIPTFGLNKIPCTVEAENYDYFSGDAEGRTYHDTDTLNTGGFYRTNDGVDVGECSEGGYSLVDLADGEWISYTIAAPASGLYNISINYAASSTGGKMKFSVAGDEISSELEVPFGGVNSTGITDWKDYTIANDIMLRQGVQTIKLHVSGSSNVYSINNLTITAGSTSTCSGGKSALSSLPSFIAPGINYAYYQGTWDAIPSFTNLTPIQEGISDSIVLFDDMSKDNFAMLYSGYIDIPMTGEYNFYTNSDAGSKLYIDNVLVVDNDGDHDVQEQVGSICLKEGFHTLKVEYFEKTGDESLDVFFEGPGLSKRLLEDIYSYGLCDQQAVELPSDVVEGLSCYLYKGEWNRDLPRFSTLEEFNRGVSEDIDFTFSNANNTFSLFGLVFKGYFSVPESDDYTFYLTSADGSRLLIDGVRAVSNDGTHGTTEVSASICLEAGYHSVQIEYFNYENDKYLEVEYAGGGASRQALSGFYSDPIPEKIPQYITMDSWITKYLGEEDFMPEYSINSDLPIVLTSSDYTNDIATIVDNKIHIIKTGRAIITATQEGNVNYTPASKSFYVEIIDKLDQTIDFAELENIYVGDPDFTLQGTATSGLPLTYQIYNGTTVASLINDSVVQVIGEGKAILSITQPGNYMYNEASKVVYITVQQPSSIEDNIASLISFYPNPASDVLNIEMISHFDATVQVYDVSGKCAIVQQLSSALNQIDISSLPEGLYFANVECDDDVIVHKFIKK